MEVSRRNEISKRLSHTLDCLGYNQEIISSRREFWNTVDFLKKTLLSELISNDLFSIESITVGSKGEGNVKLFESDKDTIEKFLHFVCVDNQYDCQQFPKNLVVILMIPCKFHPGHFKLTLKHKHKGYKYGSDSKKYMKSSGGGNYISYKQFFQSVPFDRAGPAITYQLFCSNDLVYTIPCVCSTILIRWRSRHRKYTWPSVELIHTISQMRGNMVCKGISGCEDEDIEWRLCFNEIEQLLVRSWNDTHTKLYKMLKMIKSDILKPQHKEITSFILKNVVFWLSENFPQSSFRPNNLIDWVVKALRLLKRAVKMYYLPYYMLPERNLLAERIEKYQRKKLMRQIKEVIQCGPHFLLDCEKIQFSMKMNPTELNIYGIKSFLFEKQILSKSFPLIIQPNINFQPDWLTVALTVSDLVLPWPQAVQKELDKCSSILDKLFLLLG